MAQKNPPFEIDSRPAPHPDSQSTAATQENRRRRPRRTVRRALQLLLALLAVLAVLAAALPTLLSSRPARVAVLRWINAANPARSVEVRDWRWTWFGPCRIEGISVLERDQSVALHVEGITVSKGLAAWFGYRQDFGAIMIDAPALTVLELPPPPPDAVPAPPQPPREPVAPAAPRPAVPLWFNPHGTVTLRHGRAEALPLNRPAVRVADIRGTLVLAGLQGPVELEFGSGLPHEAGRPTPGDEALVATLRVSSLLALLEAPATVDMAGKVTMPPVSLAALEAFLPPSETRPRTETGRVEADLHLKRSGDADLSASGRVVTHEVKLTGGALQPDALAWDRASLTFDVRKQPGGIAIQEVRLDSPFAALRASGVLQLASDGVAPGGTLTAEGHLDLAALTDQAPTLLRLRPGMRIERGLLRFDAEASSQATGAHLIAKLQCDGIDALQDHHPLRIDLPFTLDVNAALSATGTIDRATVALKSPPASVTAEGAPESGTVSGTIDIDALHAALAPLLDAGAEPPASGRLAFDGAWGSSAEGLAVSGLMTAEGLHVRREKQPPLRFETLRLTASATLPQALPGVPRTVRHFRMEAKAPFANVRAAAAEAVPEHGIVRAFEVAMDGQWAPLLTLAGAEGVTPLAETLAVTASGDMDAVALRLAHFRVAAGPVEVEGRATLDDLHATRNLAADGVLKLDLDGLQAVLQRHELDGVTMSGRSERPFWLSVPLGSDHANLLSELRGELGIGAVRLAGLGMVAQDVTAEAGIDQGKLTLRLEAAVNDGRLRLAPTINLQAAPPLLTLPANSRVLEDVRLTEEMLEQQLARVHPILRGSTVTSGFLSIDMPDCAIPVVSNAAQRMSWTAHMTLRDTRLVAVGALAQAADALRLRHKEVLITNQVLAVACRAGRLHPQPLDLTVGGHPLRVAGSVGLDGSLDYAIEVPLTEALVGAQAWPFLRGQTMRIPLVGAAARPRIDVAAVEAELRRLIAAVATRAATEKIRDELRDLLRDAAPNLDPNRSEDTPRRQPP